MQNSRTYGQNSFLNILREFIVLTKPRVNLLIMFTAIVGMLLAHQSTLNYELILFSSIGIGLAASAAATKSRPLVNGSIKPLHAIYFALFLSITSITMLYLLVNVLTALLTLLSIIIYSVIYSVYLKNLTSQNIVIGGIAGAMPPLLGWTSITNQIEPFPLVLFLIIFLWTPPHFWALAVYKYEDYKKANIPMLPVTHGRDFARLHIFLYSILLFCITLFPYILGLSGFIYLTGVVLIGLKFVIDSYSLMISKSASEAIALFKYSITYLAVLFALLLFDHFWYLSAS
jgi:protoheme IX farnesyltransferase